MNAILNEVLQSPGYSTQLSLRSEELCLLRDMIETQWLEVIGSHYPEHKDKFAEVGIARYHEFSHLVDHNAIWKKSNRCLSKSDVQLLKSQKFFSELKEVFGDFKMSDVIYDSTIISG